MRFLSAVWYSSIVSSHIDHKPFKFFLYDKNIYKRRIGRLIFMKKKWKDIMVMIPGKMKKHKKLTAALLVLFVLAGVFAGRLALTRKAKGKPDPEIYLKGAELINLKPEQCTRGLG